jgi:hypothetical protein
VRPSAGSAAAAHRELSAHSLALAGFFAVATLCLRPFWEVFRTDIVSDPDDPVFNLYLLKWVGHELHRGFRGFWDAPFFFPTRDVIAYSDHLFGPGLAAAALNALVPGWVAAYNLVLLASFALTGWTLCYVLRRAGRSWIAALMGGAMYAFSPFRWDQLPHLQVLLMAAIPLTLWTFDRLLAAPSWPRAAVFLMCYGVHLSGGCYLAYMIHIPLAVLALNRAPELARRGREMRWRELRVLLAVAALAAAALTVTFGEYWLVTRRDGLAWGPYPARRWGATLLSYMQPSHLSSYGGLWPATLYRPENALFPGWLAAGFGAAGAAALWRGRRRRDGIGRGRRPGWLALALAAAGWLMADLHTLSLAPSHAGLERWVVGHHYGAAFAMLVAGAAAWAASAAYTRWWAARRWWPAPPLPAEAPVDRWQRGLLLAGACTAALASPLFFMPATRLLPGLDAMRVPARFHAFTMVAVVWLAALALDRLLARVRSSGRPAPRARTAAVALGLACLLLAELTPRPVSWVELPEEDDFPQVYQWLADQPDLRALLEIPFDRADVAVPSATGAIVMYFNTLHWRPLVNGTSAHFPRDYQSLRARCCWPVPDDATLVLLRRWGVSHLLVHRSLLPAWQRAALARWDASGKAELLYAGEGDRVYRISRTGEAAAR